MAKCINQTQFSKVIDKGIDAPMHGLFIAGSEFYSSTAYPTYDPAGAARLVKQVQQQTGQQPTFSLNSTSDPGNPAGRPVPPAGVPDSRHEGEHQHPGAVDDHQRRPCRHLPGHAVAPVRCSGPRPQLRVVDDAAGVRFSGAQHGSQRRPEDPGGAGRRPRRPTRRPARIKSYQQINEYLAQDIPYLWLARDTWAVIANPKVQNFANPTTLQNSKAIAFDEGVLWPTQIWMS